MHSHNELVVRQLLAYSPMLLTVEGLGYARAILNRSEGVPSTVPAKIRDRLPEYVYITMWSLPDTAGGLVGYVMEDVLDRRYLASGILEGELLIWRDIGSEVHEGSNRNTERKGVARA